MVQQDGLFTMATIANDPDGRKRVLFYNAKQKRKAINLGRCSRRDAERVMMRVESLLVCRRLGTKPDGELLTWLVGDGIELREQFEKVGLVDKSKPGVKQKGMRLSAFLKDFVKRNEKTHKPATLIVWQQVINMLLLYMPKGITLNEITTGHAKQFVESLKERGLASSTIHKRVGFARQFFQDAVDWELITVNPFARVKTQGSSLKSNVEVPRESVAKLLKVCDPVWQGIVGLCRFGGLRCPSEVLSLKWEDINWAHDRMSVPEPKVEHHEGRGVRTVPLFPELKVILEDLREITPADAEYVIDKPEYRAAAMRPGGWANANLRTQLLKKLKKAGVQPWKRLFHSMRASRQTELEAIFPTHVVCKWMGNSEIVAKKNYLLVTQSDFDNALSGKETSEKSALWRELLQQSSDPLPTEIAGNCGTSSTPQEPCKIQCANSALLPKDQEKALFSLGKQGFLMEMKGLEPMTLCLQSRCSPN
jgi:integrase